MYAIMSIERTDFFRTQKKYNMDYSIHIILIGHKKELSDFAC